MLRTRSPYLAGVAAALALAAANAWHDPPAGVSAQGKSAAGGGGEIEWLADLDAGNERARATGKPLLIVFR